MSFGTGYEGEPETVKFEGGAQVNPGSRESILSDVSIGKARTWRNTDQVEKIVPDQHAGGPECEYIPCLRGAASGAA